MPSITLSIQYKKNENVFMSAAELKNTYFFATPVLNPENGEELSDEAWEQYITAAQSELESYLGIKIGRQAYNETKDFIIDDYISWGYVPTYYPVVEPYRIRGFLNTTLQIDYPREWLSTKRNSDEYSYHRRINLVPVSGATGAVSHGSIYVGITPYTGYFGNKNIPNYWDVTYITGMSTISAEIRNALGIMASIGPFIIAGDLIAGAGIASKSIGIDGLSQSISTTASATSGGYGSRIIEYRKILKELLPTLKAKYKGITLSSL